MGFKGKAFLTYIHIGYKNIFNNSTINPINIENKPIFLLQDIFFKLSKKLNLHTYICLKQNCTPKISSWALGNKN